MQNQVRFYMQPFYCLDNFSSFAVVMNNHVWATAEHAYHSLKFDDESVLAQIFEAKSAHDAKKIAKANNDKKRKDWQEVRVPMMEKVLRLKLAQHQYVQEKLLETGEVEIIEDSPKDSFWGGGPNNDGQNNLGKLWMKLREELLEQLNSELSNYLNLVSSVLKRTSTTTLDISPVNPSSQQYNKGFRHVILFTKSLSWHELRTVINFVRLSIEIFAETKKVRPLEPLEISGEGNTSIYVGLKSKERD